MDMGEWDQFVQDIELPCLIQSESHQMNQPITLEELYEALKTA